MSAISISQYVIREEKSEHGLDFIATLDVSSSLLLLSRAISPRFTIVEEKVSESLEA